MAYSALRSLAQILHQTLNRDCQYLILDEKQQIESLVEKITSLQKDFSLQKITQEAETDIRDAAYIAEDIIESGIIERFRTESAGHEDGSTEKNLIRFDVVQNIFSSKSTRSGIESGIIEIFRTESAGHEDGSTEKNLIRFDVVQNIFSSKSTRSGLEIVGLGGIEKPCTFQTINGIEQLARTRQFKAWFLDSIYVVSRGITAIQRLATCGTKIVIISLMGASETMEELRTWGLDTSLFVGAITIERVDGPRFGQEAAMFSKMYKSAMVMAGVDAADRCIAVGGHLHYIKAAYAAGISSIFLTGDLYGRLEFADIRDLAAKYGAHPTYLLPSFTW